MSCKYCEEFVNEYLFSNRDRRGKKSDGYPGVEVCLSITDDNKTVLYVGGCADVYEPSWIEAEVEINYCPMCGRKLS